MFDIKAFLQRFKRRPKMACTVDVYFGVPGSGKSTVAACLARKAIKADIPVWSNLYIRGAYALDARKDLGVSMISDGLIIVDEAGIDYNNRNFKSFDDTQNFFWKYHRHYKTKIAVFSQSFEDFDKKIRLLAQRYYVVSRSILPFFICCHEYTKKVGVNELTKDFCDEYVPVPWYCGGIKLFFAPPAWKMFDSYSRRELPSKEWQKWEDVK